LAGGSFLAPTPSARSGPLCSGSRVSSYRAYKFVWNHRKAPRFATAREFAMKRSVFAVGLLVAGLAMSTPARADFALVQFGDGDCRICWDSGDNPWGAGWTKVAVGLPDYQSAQTALSSAIAQSICR
jgi:hypothetical protein